MRTRMIAIAVGCTILIQCQCLAQDWIKNTPFDTRTWNPSTWAPRNTPSQLGGPSGLVQPKPGWSTNSRPQPQPTFDQIRADLYRDGAAIQRQNAQNQMQQAQLRQIAEDQARQDRQRRMAIDQGWQQVINQGQMNMQLIAQQQAFQQQQQWLAAQQQQWLAAQQQAMQQSRPQPIPSPVWQQQQMQPAQQPQTFSTVRYQVPAEYAGAAPGLVVNYGGTSYVTNSDGTMSPYQGAASTGIQPQQAEQPAAQRYQVPAEYAGTAPGLVITYGGASYLTNSDGTMSPYQGPVAR